MSSLRLPGRFQVLALDPALGSWMLDLRFHMPQKTFCLSLPPGLLQLPLTSSVPPGLPVQQPLPCGWPVLPRPWASPSCRAGTPQELPLPRVAILCVVSGCSWVFMGTAWGQEEGPSVSISHPCGVWPRWKRGTSSAGQS